MKNLKSIIQYECLTSFKYIWTFYAFEFLFISLIAMVSGFVMGNFEDIALSCLEINTVIYVSILGVLGFKEDFKMLIQNGFTRNYIFIATLSMFTFVSGIMAFIDTIIGNVLHHFNNNYFSMYGSLYGYGNIFMNWLCLFLFYIVVCSLLYLVILVINKVGKNGSIYIGIILSGIVLFLVSLFRFVFSGEISNNLLQLIKKALGFMSDGTINYLFPVLTLLLVILVLGVCSYAIIRKTELN